MKIRHKFIIGCLALTSLVASVGYLGIIMTSAAKEGFTLARDHTIPMIKALEALRFAGLRIVSSTSEGDFIRAEMEVIGQEVAQTEKEEERLIKLRMNLYNDSLKEYEDVLSRYPIEEGRLLHDIAKKGLRLQQTSEALLRLKRQGVSGLEVQKKKEEFERNEKAFLGAVDAAISNEGSEFLGKKAELESSLEAGRNLGIAATVISLIVAVIIGAFLSRSILNPITVLRDAAGEIGRGNLDARADIKSSDEIGQLAISFNKMAEDLRRYHKHLGDLLEVRTAERKPANERLQQEIADRKHTKESVQRADSELEEQVEERTAALAKANEKLKREITECKKAEEALRKTEAQKQAILDASVDMIMQLDTGMRIVWANRTAAAVMNKAPEDLLGHTCHKFFQNADSPCPNCPCKRALETGNIEHAIMYHAAMDTVGESYWEDYGVPLRDESGGVVGVVEIARNVTEKVTAEKALARAKEDWENTFDATTDMIMVLDDGYQVLRVNKAAAEALNTTKDSLVGKKCYEVVHGRSHPIKGCPLTLTMKALEPQSTEISEPNLGGSFICSTFPVLNGEGKLTGYVHTLKNITESKRLEAQLEQTRRLEAIGTLAGGVAHDFNNLLMGIQGNVSLMQLDIDPTQTHYRRLVNIEKQVQSGARLTSNLLGYARKGRYEVKPLNLNHLVKDTCENFGRTKKEIAIYQELAEDLLAIQADQGQIEQVLLNLLVNASDAMPGGGDLILKTGNVTHEDMKGQLHDPKPGNYVLLSVTDTGIGMDKETKDRIFDPFFTTKEMSSRGAGLGLASAYGIIKGHGGYIDVESKKEHGTTFSIYLPASERGLREPAKTAEPFVRGAETVLLVDDEEVIVEIGQELLEAMGYRVLLARDGTEAIEVYRKNQDGIDLVLLDMVMPHMGGGEAYDKMKEINPKVKVLLSSGYSIDGQAKEILERGCDGFIQKPFSMEELSGRIREILDKK